MGIIAALACISGGLVVDGFEPFGGPGDAQIFEYTGYFFQHLRFGAWPVLALDTDRVFYPYGTNAVFQPWGLERDMFHAGLRLFFGAGPWLSIYYLFSIVVSAVGAYLLAVSELGGVSAFLLGLACSVLNFHPMALVRDQPGYSMIHWTELGIIVDFLIARRVTEQRSLTMDLVVSRALFLVLSLGLDITYVAGYSLLSLSALLVYLVALLGFRAAQRRKSDVARPSDAAPLIALDRRLQPRHVAMLAITGAFLWLYVPVLVQISRAAASFDFSHIGSGTMWVSPLRLLVPLFPRVYPEGPVDAALTATS